MLIVLMLFVMAFAMPVQAAKKTKIRLNKKEATIYVGETVKLTVKGTKKKVTWRSSMRSIATVSKKGVVTGISPGVVTIRAKVAGKKLSCTVSILNRPTDTPSNSPSYTPSYVSPPITVPVDSHGYTDNDYILMAALGWIGVQAKGNYSYYIDPRFSPITIDVSRIDHVYVDTDGHIQLLYDIYYATVDPYRGNYYCYYGNRSVGITSITVPK